MKTTETNRTLDSIERARDAGRISEKEADEAIDEFIAYENDRVNKRAALSSAKVLA